MLAINNYRQSGGSGYPVADLEEVYNEQIAIREALIDWAVERQVIDQDEFHRENWVLTSETIDRSEPEPTEDPTGEPTGEPTEEPTGEPTQDPTGEPSEDPSEEPTGGPDDSRDDDQGGDDDQGRDDGDDDGRLPRTGSEIAGALGAAVALAGLGTAAVLASRRRRV